MERALISILAEEIADPRDTPRLDEYFAQNDAPPPRLAWNPGEAEVPAGPLRFLRGFWHERCADGALPRYDAVEPFALKPALGYVMLLDVLDDGWDYRYRVYGSEIAQRFGRDLTGKRTSDIAKTAYTGIFYLAGYRALIRRREALFTVSSSPNYVAAVDWSRLCLPLVDETGAIARILVGNVPGDWRPATAPLPPR